MVNYFTEFAITPAAEVDFDLDNASPASGALRKRCQALIEDVEASMGGLADGRGAAPRRVWLGLLRRPRRPQGGAGDLPQHRGRRRSPQPGSRRGQLRRHQLPPLCGNAAFGVPADKAFFYPEGVEGLFESTTPRPTPSRRSTPSVSRSTPGRSPTGITTSGFGWRSKATRCRSAPGRKCCARRGGPDGPSPLAVDALFADPNIGPRRRPRAGGRGPVPGRVIARRADAVTEFGGGRLCQKRRGSISASHEVAEPAAGRPDRDRRRGLRRAGRAGAGSRAAGLDPRCETSVKLTLDIRPDLAALMAAEIATGERAVTAAVREAGIGLKLGWRGQITGAGLGARLANSIRSEVFPKAGVSLNAAAVVWSKAPVIIGAHDAGPLIRARNGLWLAIPTPVAGKALGGRRITPAAWERKTGLQAALRLPAGGAEPARGDATELAVFGLEHRRHRRSSCSSRRSSCRSGSTSRGTQVERITQCRS